MASPKLTIELETLLGNSDKTIDGYIKHLEEVQKEADRLDVGGVISESLQGALDELKKTKKEYRDAVEDFAKQKIDTDQFDKFTKEIDSRLDEIEQRVGDTEESLQNLQSTIDNLNLDKLKNQIKNTRKSFNGFKKDVKVALDALKDFQKLMDYNHPNKNLAELADSAKKLSNVDLFDFKNLKKGTASIETLQTRLAVAYEDYLKLQKVMKDKDSSPSMIEDAEKKIANLIPSMAELLKRIATIKKVDPGKIFELDYDFGYNNKKYNFNTIINTIDKGTLDVKERINQRRKDIQEEMDSMMSTTTSSFSLGEDGITIPVVLDEEAMHNIENDLKKFIDNVSESTKNNPVDITVRFFPLKTTKQEAMEVEKHIKDIRAQIPKLENKDLSDNLNGLVDNLEREYQKALVLKIKVEFSEDLEEIKRRIQLIENAAKQADITIKPTFEVTEEEASKLNEKLEKISKGFVTDFDQRITKMSDSLNRLFSEGKVENWGIAFNSVLEKVEIKLNSMKGLLEPLQKMYGNMEAKKKPGRPSAEFKEGQSSIDKFTETMDLLRNALAERNKVPKLNAEEFTQDIQKAIDTANIPVRVPVEPNIEGFNEQLEAQLKTIPINLAINGVVGEGGNGGIVVTSQGGIAVENANINAPEAKVEEKSTSSSSTSKGSTSKRNTYNGVDFGFINKEFANVYFGRNTKNVSISKEEREATSEFWNKLNAYKDLLKQTKDKNAEISKLERAHDSALRRVSEGTATDEDKELINKYDAEYKKLDNELKTINAIRDKHLELNPFLSNVTSRSISLGQQDKMLEKYLTDKGITRKAPISSKVYLERLREDVSGKEKFNLKTNAGKNELLDIVKKFIGFQYKEKQAKKANPDFTGRGWQIEDLTDKPEVQNQLRKKYDQLTGAIQQNTKAKRIAATASEDLARKSLFEGVSTEELEKRYDELSKEKDKITKATNEDVINNSLSEATRVGQIANIIYKIRKDLSEAAVLESKGLIEAPDVPPDQLKKLGYEVTSHGYGIDAISKRNFAKQLMEQISGGIAVTEDLINDRSKNPTQLAEEIIRASKKSNKTKPIDEEMQKIATELDWRKIEDEVKNVVEKSENVDKELTAIAEQHGVPLDAVKGISKYISATQEATEAVKQENDAVQEEIQTKEEENRVEEKVAETKQKKKSKKQLDKEKKEAAEAAKQRHQESAERWKKDQVKQNKNQNIRDKKIQKTESTKEFNALKDFVATSDLRKNSNAGKQNLQDFAKRWAKYKQNKGKFNITDLTDDVALQDKLKQAVADYTVSLKENKKAKEETASTPSVDSKDVENTNKATEAVKKNTQEQKENKDLRSQVFEIIKQQKEKKEIDYGDLDNHQINQLFNNVITSAKSENLDINQTVEKFKQNLEYGKELLKVNTEIKKQQASDDTDVFPPASKGDDSAIKALSERIQKYGEEEVKIKELKELYKEYDNALSQLDQYQGSPLFSSREEVNADDSIRKFFASQLTKHGYKFDEDKGDFVKGNRKIGFEEYAEDFDVFNLKPAESIKEEGSARQKNAEAAEEEATKIEKSNEAKKGSVTELSLTEQQIEALKKEQDAILETVDAKNRDKLSIQELIDASEKLLAINNAIYKLGGSNDVSSHMKADDLENYLEFNRYVGKYTKVKGKGKGKNYWYNESDVFENESSAKPISPAPVGERFGEEYIQGILSKVSETREAAAKLPENAEDATANAQKSKSPSKVAEKLGEYWGEGYADGILNTQAKVKNAVRALVETAKLTMDDLRKDNINETDTANISKIVLDEIYSGKNPTKMSQGFVGHIQDVDKTTKQKATAKGQMTKLINQLNNSDALTMDEIDKADFKFEEWIEKAEKLGIDIDEFRQKYREARSKFILDEELVDKKDAEVKKETKYEVKDEKKSVPTDPKEKKKVIDALLKDQKNYYAEILNYEKELSLAQANKDDDMVAHYKSQLSDVQELYNETAKQVEALADENTIQRQSIELAKLRRKNEDEIAKIVARRVAAEKKQKEDEAQKQYFKEAEERNKQREAEEKERKIAELKAAQRFGEIVDINTGVTKPEGYYDYKKSTEGEVWIGALQGPAEELLVTYDKLLEAEKKLDAAAKDFEKNPVPTYAKAFKDARDEVSALHGEIRDLSKDVSLESLSESQAKRWIATDDALDEIYKERQANAEILAKKEADLAQKQEEAAQKQAEAAEIKRQKELTALMAKYDKMDADAQKAKERQYADLQKASDKKAESEEKTKVKQINTLLSEQKASYEKIWNIRKKIAGLDPNKNQSEIQDLRAKEKVEQIIFNSYTKQLKVLDDTITTEQLLNNLVNIRRDALLDIDVILGKRADKERAEYMKEREKTVNSFSKVQSQINKQGIDIQFERQSDKHTGKFNNELDKIIQRINEINSKPLDVITDQDIAEAQILLNDILNIRKQGKLTETKKANENSLQKNLAQVNSILSSNTKSSFKRTDVYKDFISLQTAFKTFDTSRPQSELAELTTELLKVKARFEELDNTVKGKNLFQTFIERLHGTTAQLVAQYLSWMDIIRYIRQMATTIIDLDTQLVDLRKTTSMTTGELDQFYHASADIGKQLGVTSSEIIQQAAAWSRLGYSTKEAATQMAQLSSKFATVSPGMTTEQSTDYLVSTMQAFGIEVDDVERKIMDNVNRIGNTFATTNAEIGEMLTRSSAAMKAANNTLEETIALESAAVEVTRNAETTGTAFRTVSMRIRGFDEETEEALDNYEELKGKIADLTKTTSTPGGVSLFTDASKTEYKSTYQFLKDISKIWDELTDKNQAALLEAIGGKRGAQSLASILADFSEVERAMSEMEGAAGSADAEMGIVEQSIEYKINALKQTWIGTLTEITDRGEIGKLVDGLTDISEGFGNVIDKLGVFKTVAVTALSVFGSQKLGYCN